MLWYSNNHLYVSIFQLQNTYQIQSWHRDRVQFIINVELLTKGFYFRKGKKKSNLALGAFFGTSGSNSEGRPRKPSKRSYVTWATWHILVGRPISMARRWSFSSAMVSLEKQRDSSKTTRLTDAELPNRESSGLPPRLLTRAISLSQPRQSDNCRHNFLFLVLLSSSWDWCFYSEMSMRDKLGWYGIVMACDESRLHN